MLTNDPFVLSEKTAIFWTVTVRLYREHDVAPHTTATVPVVAKSYNGAVNATHKQLQRLYSEADLWTVNVVDVSNFGRTINAVDGNGRVWQVDLRFYETYQSADDGKGPRMLDQFSIRNVFNGVILHSPDLKNADGTPQRWKVTSVKTWKTDRNRVEVHIKRGLKEFATINADTAHHWYVAPSD